MRVESAFNNGTVGFFLDVMEAIGEKVNDLELIVENGKIYYDDGKPEPQTNEKFA